MKALITLAVFSIILQPVAHAQNATEVQNDSTTVVVMESPNTAARDNTTSPSPYKMSWKVDGPIIVGGIGLTALGTYLIGKKKPLTDAQLDAKSRNDIPFFDRGNAGYYSKKADKDSYVPFNASFALPVVFMLINKNERQKPFQVLAMYIETMAVTGTLFTMATGNIYRSRPYVYGNLLDRDRRKDNDAQRSFFAGHTAATAAATFYTAKVFSDFNPDSKARIWVWGLAAAIPASVGYLRYKAGMHFLSDNLLGYGIGAAAGILIPEWHKVSKLKNMSFVPLVGTDYKGLAYTYTF